MCDLFGMIELTAGRIMLDHFLERSQASVVHVRRGYCDVPQRGRSEFSDILGSSGLFKEPAIGSGVGGDSGVEEPAARATELPSKRIAPLKFHPAWH